MQASLEIKRFQLVGDCVGYDNSVLIINWVIIDFAVRRAPKDLQ